jgi:alpha-mannosidase
VRTPYDERRLERLTRRLEELRAWRNARELPVPEVTFAVDGETHSLPLKAFWPVVTGPVRFTAQTKIPSDWAGQPVELELWLGGEGFVRITAGETTLQSGLDPFHHAFPLTEAAAGGEPVALDAEVMPKGMFGSHVAEPRVERAHLVVPHREVRALERDLTMLLDACAVLGDHEAVPHLLEAADAAFDALAFGWPTNLDVAISRYAQGYVNPIGSGVDSVHSGYAVEAYDVRFPHDGLWRMPDPPRPLEPLPAVAVAAVNAARAGLSDRLAALRERFPPVGQLLLTGHAHIDLAWLWPLAETHRKARRTFASVLDLMDRYDDFTFNQSSAQLYAWVEEEAPDLFERVRQRVAEGRWETIGGSWLEPDCMVTGGEAFVRHLLYGQRYFESRFGKRSTVAWLPDVFGFSAGIPQLLRGAGIGGFFTIKLTWNETNPFPYDLFAWQGLDGSRVTANMFRNLPPAFGYNGNIAPLDTFGTWRNFGGKRLHDESLLAFGWGDGGGGPSFRMLENYARIQEFPALPRLRMGKIEDYFARLPGDGLPVWVGELYLELHRGTLTTQGKVKALNRAAEHRLLEAEVFAALARLVAPAGFADPHDALGAAWRTLLLNQFHDVLPGSSINEVYQDAHRQLGEVVEAATTARDTALGQIQTIPGNAATAATGGGLIVANAGLQPRPLSALVAGAEAGPVFRDASGALVPTQPTEDGLLVHASACAVPGLGWTVLTAEPAGATTAPSVAHPVRIERHGDATVLEHEELRVEIGTDGTVSRMVDVLANREVLAGRGNQLWVYVDKPRNWEAWDVDEDYERAGDEIGGVEAIEVVETGPLRAAVRVSRAWRDSRIVQTYRLLAGSKRLDVETTVDWRERNVLLRARFPLAVHAEEATYETMFGAVRRATHRNTTFEQARFEVSGHRFADLSEPGYGVALLNDGKYGHAAHGNVLSLSLLRGPLYPDPYADAGEHRFAYALYPHAGDWTAGGVTREAFAFNSPLVARPVATGGSLPTSWCLVACDGIELALGSLKRAEEGDGLILRLYEPHGARGLATLRFARPIQSAERATLLEEHDPSPVAEATEPVVTDNVLRLSVRPFEVVTLRVVL